MEQIISLENQLVIMQALLTLVKDEEMIKKLEQQIMFTKARIRVLS